MESKDLTSRDLINICFGKMKDFKKKIPWQDQK